MMYSMVHMHVKSVDLWEEARGQAYVQHTTALVLPYMSVWCCKVVVILIERSLAGSLRLQS